jgi:inner membrane protein
MTGRTHDLAGFTALTFVMVTYPLSKMTLATALVAFSANMIGSLAPDIDQPTAALWHRMRAGSIIGKLVQPLLGGHRLISHSIIGIFLFGAFTNFLLGQMKSFLLVDMNIVWWAFMIGFLSHLLTDTFTREGVPWLFPIPINLGIPPFRFMRFKTGGIVEKSFVFPMLLITNIVLYYTNYGKFVEFLKNYLIK